MQNTGCCGADCNACAARKATVRQDNAALAKLAADEEGAGRSFVLPSRLRCTGCLAHGAKSISCAECAIRACAMSNHIPHCGFCPEFPCNLGSAVWEAVPEYKHNIDVLKSR
ncbi:MAG: DUF3795 domain-containing protein [Synergistes sp.]|nr:DUF3795 domain-containing protein [Synergistes sp.]